MFRPTFAALAAAAIFLTAPAFAANYAAGTCLPNLPSFETISQAVSSVPSGSTIEVCPGRYPEQIVITQPLTLEGVPNAASDAVIVVPSGGLSQTVDIPDFGGLIPYQVLVQATGPVNLINLAIDGTGADAGGQITMAGIIYLDASGRAANLALRNQQCQLDGFGVLAITTAAAAQTVSVENSVIRGFDNAGMWTESDGGPMTVNLTSNIINGKAATLTNAFVYSLRATGTVQSNLISGASVPVLINSSQPVRVTENTISESSVNKFVTFYLTSASATIANNRVDLGGATGFWLFGGATNSVIQHNTFGNAGLVMRACGASGYTFNFNTITDAATGFMSDGPNTMAPNNYYAVGNAEQSCTYGRESMNLARKLPGFLRAR